MITISLCTSAEHAAVADLWNSKTLDSASCWFQTATVDPQFVGGLLATGYAVFVARENSVVVGFGMWCGPAEFPRLIALAADAQEVYYRLMRAFCAESIAGGATRGFAEIGTEPTAEKARMDALGVIEYRPIGFEPLAADAQPEDRVPLLLRAECDLAVLSQAVDQLLETIA
jgi:hypothetical protein